ncbi:MAG: YjgP/YjgQ family permease [Synechococcus sp. SB0662_bin_45]|nr:LptF/LptG family permease [Cyanobacteria bacterium MAG IRC4_bin_6]MXW12446.1 YjgP/YjgQ family permease [Synechococcus sp. SB0668_bin_13]MXX08695.1 YjgP/YjgQ family permease [Synechococcus sp. SB0667_bin_8]MXY19539.1 YjgP/YjgQ family permease [Synechococcus sp. SB0664_bin_36]MYE22209.1 YjgP/YjgQ family permease [Synechococcus sp. SB0662_bin_45]MYG64393.1 YjgP/YjgQ family permease [Synechococcus sp. SB0675_bin_7]MYI71088.1 YjgP/YjgQ family permease [Synechococcus sp. SB0673_bin_10]MYK07222.
MAPLSLLTRRLSLLDRWLYGELLGPLLFGVAIFSLLLVTGDALFDLVRKVVERGLPIGPALQVLVLQLPSLVVYAFPMAMLLGTLLTYSKLSSGNELIALRSVGVPTRRYVLPAMVLGLFFSVASFMVSDLVVPRSNHSSFVVLQTALGRSIPKSSGEHIIYPHLARIPKADGGSYHGLAQLFYAREAVDGHMKDITVLDMSRPGMLQVVQAREAYFDEEQGSLLFLDGTTTSLADGGGSQSQIRFEEQFYPIGDTPLRLAEIPTDAANMTVAQIRMSRTLLEQTGNLRQARKLSVRLQEKFSVPLSCVVFALVGSSIGAQSVGNARSRGKGFGISLIIIFGYYLLSFVFSSFGVQGILPPYLSAWAPVAIGLTAGLVLLRRSSR